MGGWERTLDQVVVCSGSSREAVAPRHRRRREVPRVGHVLVDDHACIFSSRASRDVVCEFSSPVPWANPCHLTKGGGAPRAWRPLSRKHAPRPQLRTCVEVNQ